MVPQTIGIAGLGFLGRGIAACLLSYGFRVVAYDPSEAARRAARAEITRDIDDLVRRGGFPEPLLAEWPARYTEASSYADFAACDFVIESVFEDLAVKELVFDQIEAVARPSIPIATNTSAMPITLLQRNRRNPNRFVGTHFCSPAHLTRFLEVIRGDQTDDATVDAALALGRACGKDPSLVQKDVEGFIINRIGYAIYREALHLLESGVADVETIDDAFRNVVGLYANICGPFRWMDLTGLPAYAAVMKRLFPKLSNAGEIPRPMRELIESGATGVANGRGFYRYTPEEAQRWHKLLIEHVWKVREMNEEYFPKERE